MPSPLRHDHDHAGSERQDCGPSSVIRCKRRGTVDDLHEFIAVPVALPGAVAGKFGGENGAVAEGSQRGEAGFLRGPASVISGVRPRRNR